MRPFLLLIPVFALGCSPGEQTQPPPPAARILLVSIDGLRPDLLLRASAPNTRALARSGCFSYWARTVDPPLTLPSHTSMLTGVYPERHGIWINLEDPDDPVVPPAVPTLFEAAKKAGYTTALAAGKPKFEAIAMRGSIDWLYLPEPPVAEDRRVAAEAARLISSHRPELMVVHLAGVDVAGHASGWGSPRQLHAVEKADRAFGIVLDSLRRAGLRNETVILLTADHGGSGLSHWRGDERSIHIPWIISGPGLRRNLDLTRDAGLTISTVDTFATICHLMGIPQDPDIDGRPILQILARAELLQDAPIAGAPAAAD